MPGQKNSKSMSYSAKHIFASLLVGILPASAFGYWYSGSCVSLTKLVSDFCNIQVTYGLTLGGFFLASASILAGFSATDYLARLTRAKRTWNTLLSVIFLATAFNLTLGVSGWVSYWVVNCVGLPDYVVRLIASTNVFLFFLSGYFTFLCILLIKDVLVNISLSPND